MNVFLNSIFISAIILSQSIVGMNPGKKSSKATPPLTETTQLIGKLKGQQQSLRSGKNIQQGEIRETIDQVKNSLVQDVERMLERGTQVEVLVNKTNELNAQAVSFMKASEKSKRLKHKQKYGCLACCFPMKKK